MSHTEILKVDGDYIALPDDYVDRHAGVPMKGQGNYCRSAGEALYCLGADTDEFAGIPGCAASRSEVTVIVNRHASAELIRKHGFTPVYEWK